MAGGLDNHNRVVAIEPCRHLLHRSRPRLEGANTIFDAFGTNGLGDSSHVLQLPTATFVRADNSIGYFLPSNIGGVYGQFMAAAGEGGGNGTTSINPGRYLGGRIGFAAGPFDVAAAYAQQRFSGTRITQERFTD